MFSVDGLVSGLDTTSIIEGALALQQSRLDRLAVEKQEIRDEQTVFKTIEAQLLGLRGSLGTILRSTNNAFDKKTVTSSDEEAIAVSASSQAASGSYRFRVTQLAQAHQVKTNDFASSSEEINKGSLSIQVGDRAEVEVTIDSDNNTLQGLADAINSQSDDVTASIIDEGSGERPLRLLLTSRHTGADNEIKITNSLGSRRGRDGEDDELTQPDFTAPAVEDPLDAQVQLGSGEGAITISSATNQFEDLFDGVTFDAFRADAEKEIVVTVEEDTGQVTDAIQGFVDAYNSVIEFIDGNSTFDADSETAGLLLGNRSAISVQSTLRAAVSTVVDGVDENLRTLSSVGITTSSQGTLSLNTSRLEDILKGRVDGVGINDVRRLFAIDGVSDNPGIEFVLGTNKTQASPQDPVTGELIPYEVEINRVASSALLEAAESLLESTVVSSLNNQLTVEVDNVEIPVVIPDGTYTRDELASQIQTLINTSPDRSGREISARINGELLELTSASVGDSSTIGIVDGSALATLGLTEGQSASGTDVAGVFRVQLPGQTETITEQATGNGRILSGDAENEYTAQLQVRSTLSESQIGAATDGYITVSRGLGAALDQAIENLLDLNGELSNAQDRFNLQIEAIDDNIERVETRLEARRDSLTREYAALESTLAELESVGTALSSGLSSALTL